MNATTINVMNYRVRFSIAVPFTCDYSYSQVNEDDENPPAIVATSIYFDAVVPWLDETDDGDNGNIAEYELVLGADEVRLYLDGDEVPSQEGVASAAVLTFVVEKFDLTISVQRLADNDF